MGSPIPKIRARFRRCGQHVMTYDPKDREKKAVVQILKEQWDRIYLNADKALREEALLISSGAPLVLTADFYMPIAKYGRSGDVNKALWGFEQHVKKPDLDNLVKFYEDCLNSVCFSDDSQVVQIHAYKYYSQTPRTEIEIMISPDVEIPPKAKLLLSKIAPDTLVEMMSDAELLASWRCAIDTEEKRQRLGDDMLQSIAERLSDFAQKYGALLKKLPTYKPEVDDIGYKDAA